MCATNSYNPYFINYNTNTSGNESDTDSSVIIVDSDYNSDSDSDSGSYLSTDDYSDDYNTDEGIEYDSIHNEDAEHFYSEKLDNKYYIGLCNFYQTSYIHYILLSTSVSPTTFFNHSYNNINNYLYYYGLTRIPNPKIQILQLKIQNFDNYDTYTAIIKTYWLRLIQRHWKNIFKKRQQIIQLQCKPQNIKYKSIHGIFPYNISQLPTLRGMMSIYQK